MNRKYQRRHMLQQKPKHRMFMREIRNLNRNRHWNLRKDLRRKRRSITWWSFPLRKCNRPCSEEQGRLYYIWKNQS